MSGTEKFSVNLQHQILFKSQIPPTEAQFSKHRLEQHPLPNSSKDEVQFVSSLQATYKYLTAVGKWLHTGRASRARRSRAESWNEENTYSFSHTKKRVVQKTSFFAARRTSQVGSHSCPIPPRIPYLHFILTSSSLLSLPSLSSFCVELCGKEFLLNFQVCSRKGLQKNPT
jgi:hypothetical protein